jgi:hypothetical protein
MNNESMQRAILQRAGLDGTGVKIQVHQECDVKTTQNKYWDFFENVSAYRYSLQERARQALNKQIITPLLDLIVGFLPPP